MIESKNDALNTRIAEVEDAFEYVKKIALDAVTTKRVTDMNFTIRFSIDSIASINVDITELYI